MLTLTAMLSMWTEVTIPLGFDATHTVSTRHQWFTCVRLPGSYPTHLTCAFYRNAHHPGS